MPLDTERDDLLFDMRMALMYCLYCRAGPKDERNERVRKVQAQAILDHLIRCGWTITRGDRNTDIKPSNIGE
jgi:hypothetical protein